MSTRDTLIDLVGERAALKLMRRFAGRIIRIPNPPDRSRTVRNARIREALATKTYRAVAPLVDLSVRQVKRIGKTVESE